jgi:hypothetical protein
MNEDDDRKKRKEDRPTGSSGTEGESERPNKRQRIVELPTIDIPSRPNLLEGLRQLGSNLALVSSENRIPSVQVSENFDKLQRELNEALEAAFSEAQTIVAQNEERQRAEERNAMAEAEYSHHQFLQQSFLQRLQPLTLKMSQQLTYGEQAQMFEVILTSINNRLNENNYNQSEPNKVILLMELASITYNFALEQLAVTLSNIYQATPQITTQLISLITASAMIFNYLPEMVRGQYVAIPYLGPLFTLMNRVNPVAVRLQNSAAIVTTIYYLLRNAGIDTTDSIAAIGSSAQELISTCSIEVGRFVCSGAGLVSNSVTSIVNTLSTRLGKVLTQNYSDSQQSSAHESSQDSRSSISSISTSISSQRSVNLSETQNSNRTEVTIQNVQMLLDTPVSEGGININPNIIPGEIVEQRLNAIAVEDSSNPIIAADPEQPDSVASDISGSESQLNWSAWLFGSPLNNRSSQNSPSSSLELGGRRIRRHYKKTRKHRITRKHKKHKKYPKKTTKKNIKKHTKRRKTKHNKR